MEENSCTLTGVIATLEAARQTPAGVSRQRFWLEHRSRQQENGEPREVQARLAVIVTGGTQQALREGQRVKVSGFIARAGYRGEARDRMQLHATRIDCLD